MMIRFEKNKDLRASRIDAIRMHCGAVLARNAARRPLQANPTLLAFLRSVGSRAFDSPIGAAADTQRKCAFSEFEFARCAVLTQPDVSREIRPEKSTYWPINLTDKNRALV